MYSWLCADVSFKAWHSPLGWGCQQLQHCVGTVMSVASPEHLPRESAACIALGDLSSHQQLPENQTSFSRDVLAHHRCGLWSAWCPSGHPGPFLLNCFPVWWPLTCTDAFPLVQGFALLFGKLRKAPVSPILLPDVPLDGSTTLWSVSHSCQFCVICKLLQVTVPIIQIINEEAEQGGTQHWPLEYTPVTQPNWTSCCWTGSASFQSTVCSCSPHISCVSGRILRDTVTVSTALLSSTRLSSLPGQLLFQVSFPQGRKTDSGLLVYLN